MQDEGSNKDTRTGTEPQASKYTTLAHRFASHTAISTCDAEHVFRAGDTEAKTQLGACTNGDNGHDADAPGERPSAQPAQDNVMPQAELAQDATSPTAIVPRRAMCVFGYFARARLCITRES